MADRLTLKGYKVVTGQTGSDLSWVQPMKGGDFHLFPRWWNKKNTVQYEAVTIFRLSRAAGDLDIVIPTSLQSKLEIMWDDATESFKFPYHRGIERIGIYAANGSTLLQEYQFSRIAGGSVLKRSLTNLPSPTIGNASITGSATADVGISQNYSIAFDGDAGDAVYAWTTSDSSAALLNENTATLSVVFSAEGDYDISCTITSVLSSDTPVAETFSVTAT
mgnify:CR=1 FL=1|tara:strand:+ start:998 stop:1657 length:660 start_codon:yes stop_codon:yes gene_type:complete